MARKSSEEILRELRAADDGLPVRRIGVWSLEKLATLLLYVPAYARACQSAGGGFYVEGFAGEGLARVRGAQAEPRFVWGSPLVALRARPAVEQCLLLELDPLKKQALASRCESFGTRADVRKGDVNTDLVSFVGSKVPPWAPCFCFLDPEGFELHWDTVRGLAQLPGRNRKPELMILFPLEMAVVRVLTIDQEIRAADRTRVSKVFGNDSWWETYQARLRGKIEPKDAKQIYLATYLNQVRELGYQHVISRPVLAYVGPAKKRRSRYHLIFATDHLVGEEIMKDIFERPFVLDFPVSSQPTLFDA